MVLFDSQTEFDAPLSYAKCPSCQNEFMLATINGNVVTEARKCRYCGFWIEESKILLSSFINQNLAESLQSAEDIKGSAPVIIFLIALVFIEIVLALAIKDSSLLHITFGFTSVILLSGFIQSNEWMKKYKDLRIYDRELSEAKKRVRMTRFVWSLGILVNVMFWISFFVFIK